MRRKIIQMVKNSEPNIKYTILSGKIEMDDFNPNKPNRNRINNQADVRIKVTQKKSSRTKNQKLYNRRFKKNEVNFKHR